MEILAERRKGRWGIDKEFLVDLLERAFESPFLPLDFSKQNGQERKWRVDEKDTVGAAQPHHQKLLPLDHAVPSVHGKIDDLGWHFIHFMFFRAARGTQGFGVSLQPKLSPRAQPNGPPFRLAS